MLRGETERVEGVGGKHRVKREGGCGEVSAREEGREREECDRGKEDREGAEGVRGEESEE